MSLKSLETCRSIKFLSMVPNFPDPVAVEFTTGFGPCGRHVQTLTYEVSERFLKVTQISHPVDELEGLRERYKVALYGYMRDREFIKEPAAREAHHASKGVELDGIKKQIKAIEDQREIKEFIYKIDDIVGRITATR